MRSLPVLSTAHHSTSFSNMRDSQMNRKLWGIALSGVWKGFVSAKAEHCVNGRSCKGIRSECTSAAKRTAEQYLKAQWSWTLCLWAPVQAPWAGVQASPGVPRVGRGRAEHPGYVKFSLDPQEPIPGQISLCSSWG